MSVAPRKRQKLSKFVSVSIVIKSDKTINKLSKKDNCYATKYKTEKLVLLASPYKKKIQIVKIIKPKNPLGKKITINKEKTDLNKYMTLCSCLCIISYALASFSGNPVLSLIGCAICGFSVGVMWPGAFSLASESFPKGGTAMFAILALAGDFGCSFGPTVVGFATSLLGDDIKKGVFAAVIFPVLLIASLMIMKKLQTKTNKLDKCC